MLLLCVCLFVQEDDELLAKGDLDCHALLAVRLRRAEKKILHSVVSYSALQKASAAERCEQAAAELQNDDADVASASQPFHISSVPTVTGEQEFVRINDGVQVYGTEAERAASDAEFFESVRRGDCRASHSQSSDSKPADEQSSAASLESNVASDLTLLDIRTCSESGGIVSDCPVSTADSGDTGIDVSPASVDVNSL